MSKAARLTFLGTGTSQGVPIIACTCAICLSANQKDKRLRTSVLIETDQTSFVIDSGPDFRQQMLRAKVASLDALLFTHSHKDHLGGLDDVRAFNYILNRPMDVYATHETECMIRNDFAYIFSEPSYPGVPQIQLHTIDAAQSFQIGDITIQPIAVMHHKMPVLGFRIGNLTYITDANYISSKELEKIKGSEILILNALRREKHISHFTLSEALDIANQTKVSQAYFTHISHQLGLHDDVNNELPENRKLAYDGLTIDFEL